MSKKNVEQNSYLCCQCGEKFNSLSQFFKTYSGLYSGTGYLPICKECLTRLFNSYNEKYGDEKKAIQRICMAFDLYYDDSIFDTCKNEKEFLIGNYIKRLNMVQYKGKTFDTTLDRGLYFDGTIKKKRIKEESTNKNGEETIEISPEDIEMWGDGFDSADYGVLNSHYKLLKNANPNGDSNQEIFIVDLCFTKMQQMKAVKEGRVDDFNKLTDSYRKSFKEAGLKTVKDTNVNEEFSIGVNAETIEKYTPAEYYKGKELYRDYDGIGDYISRFLLRPLKNLMNGTKDRDYEFYVKDEDEADESTEE